MENKVKGTFKTTIRWRSHKGFAPSNNRRKYLVVTLSGWVTTLEYNAEHDAFAWSDEFQNGIDVLYWAEIPDELIENMQILRDEHFC